MSLAEPFSRILRYLRTLALAVTLNLSLAGTGTPPVCAAEPLPKSHPGHYVALNEQQELRDMRHLDEPALQGVSRRYYWADLEPRKGVYDFDAIRKDLAFLQEHHKQLVVFITDKTFQPGKNPLPGYLSSYALPNQRGMTAMRWDPVVVERAIALHQALAREFDRAASFEGVALQESALMLSPAVRQQHGYTPERYRDALTQVLRAANQAFSQSRVFWYMNHLEDHSDYLAQIAQELLATHVAMGGPDILPYRKRLQQAYQLYDRFNGKLTLFCSAQDDSYRHDKNDSRTMGNAGATWNQPPPTDGYVPLEEIFLFARDRLHVSYLFWSYNYGAGKGAYTYDDALAVMRKHPKF